MTSQRRPKAYSYLRFSTPEQMAGDSFRRQSKLAQEYAARHKLDLDLELTFQDLGVSAFRGKNLEEGRLGYFKEAVRSGLVEPGSYLLVESLDRISRDKARRAMRVLEDIVDMGVTLVTLNDGREYDAESFDSDPLTLLVSLLTFIRANDESDTKSRRLKAAWEGKREAARDRPLTSIAPAWIKLTSANGFKLIPERAQVVKRIFADTLSGAGQNAIAKSLNEEEVPVFGRGSQWHRSYIAKILRNPSVVGTYVPHRIEYVNGTRKRIPLAPIENYYPPVVQQQAFEDVQALGRGGLSPRRGRNAKRPIQNIFGGLAKCPKCSSTMTRVSKGPRGGKPYLVCTRAKTGAGCQYVSVDYNQIEKAFLDQIEGVCGNMPLGDGSTEIDGEIDQLETIICVLEDGRENLLKTIEAGRGTQSVTDRLRLVEHELETENNRLSDLLEKRRVYENKLIVAREETLKVAANTPADKLDRGAVNRALRSLALEVVVDYGEGVLMIAWQHGGHSVVHVMWPKKYI